jgi:hypothetical protein
MFYWNFTDASFFPTGNFCWRKSFFVAKLENHFMRNWIFPFFLRKRSFRVSLGNFLKIVKKLLKNITPINFLKKFQWNFFPLDVARTSKKHRNEPHYLKVIIFRAQTWFYDVGKRWKIPLRRKITSLIIMKGARESGKYEVDSNPA